MTTISSFSLQIADPEQRHLHVESQIRSGIPLQIRATRESRGWTQTTLAEKIGTTQNAISRLENPASGKPNISTLERLAEAFDVALVVRFVPFSQFVKLVDDMDTSSVAIPDYDHDPGFRSEENDQAMRIGPRSETWNYVPVKKPEGTTPIPTGPRPSIQEFPRNSVIREETKVAS